MKKKISQILYAIYIFLVIWIILFKLSSIHIGNIRSLNLIPFYYDNEINLRFHITEIIENILIFIPIGIYMKMLDKKKIILKGFIFSFILELMQFILGIGASDITDIITNTLGCGLGIIIYEIMHKLFKNKTNNIITIIALIFTILFIAFLTITFISNDNYIYEENDNILVLVNKDNKIPEDFTPNIVEYKNSKLSSEIIGPLNNMLENAKKEGYDFEISSSYRTYEEQEKIYNDRIQYYENIGMKNEEAILYASNEVALPGHSEHETGLAVDLSLNGSAEYKEKAWKYLEEISYKYGFIQRYQEDKESITGINNEPWHYRYVNTVNAKNMYDNNYCLEEYIKNNE